MLENLIEAIKNFSSYSFADLLVNSIMEVIIEVVVKIAFILLIRIIITINDAILIVSFPLWYSDELYYKTKRRFDEEFPEAPENYFKCKGGPKSVPDIKDVC